MCCVYYSHNSFKRCKHLDPKPENLKGHRQRLGDWRGGAWASCPDWAGSGDVAAAAACSFKIEQELGPRMAGNRVGPNRI